MIQKPEDYNKYNRLCGVSTHHDLIFQPSLALTQHQVRPPARPPPLTDAARK